MNKLLATLALSLGFCQILPAKTEDVQRVKKAYEYMLAIQNAPKPEPKVKEKKIKAKKMKKKKEKDLSDWVPYKNPSHIDWAEYSIIEMKAVWVTFVAEDSDHHHGSPMSMKLTPRDIENLVFELFSRLEEKNE